MLTGDILLDWIYTILAQKWRKTRLLPFIYFRDTNGCPFVKMFSETENKAFLSTHEKNLPLRLVILWNIFLGVRNGPYSKIKSPLNTFCGIYKYFSIFITESMLKNCMFFFKRAWNQVVIGVSIFCLTFIAKYQAKQFIFY